jgi:SH3-like domain-containing protein
MNNALAVKDYIGWKSFKSDDVNVRTGPGTRYPIKWIYKRKNMPLKVLAKYDNWYKIEDFEGETGWAHPNMLSEKRTFVVSANEVIMKKSLKENSRSIVKLEKGVIGTIDECLEDLCKIEIEKYIGYVPSSSIWGNKIND